MLKLGTEIKTSTYRTYYNKDEPLKFFKLKNPKAWEVISPFKDLALILIQINTGVNKRFCVIDLAKGRTFSTIATVDKEQALLDASATFTSIQERYCKDRTLVDSIWSRFDAELVESIVKAKLAKATDLQSLPTFPLRKHKLLNK